jgi:hypothetical protein
MFVTDLSEEPRMTFESLQVCISCIPRHFYGFKLITKNITTIIWQNNPQIHETRTKGNNSRLIFILIEIYTTKFSI